VVVLFGTFFAYRVTMTILFLQTGTLGLVLVLLAMFLYRMFAVGERWKYPMIESGINALSGYSRAPQKIIPLDAAVPTAYDANHGLSSQERVRVVVTTKEMIPPETIKVIMSDTQNSEMVNEMTQAYQTLPDHPKNQSQEERGKNFALPEKPSDTVWENLSEKNEQEEENEK
jgi:hypothetical protein